MNTTLVASFVALTLSCLGSALGWAQGGGRSYHGHPQ